MLADILALFIHWAVMALSLWAASRVFKGIRFADTRSLVISALMLGFVNAFLRPLLFVLTLPLTIVTLGLFLLILNALLLILVSKLVRGFSVSGFWTAFFASIVISLLSLLFGALLFGGDVSWVSPQPMQMEPRWI